MKKSIILIKRYEIMIPIILGLLFLLVTLPGISWGVPDLWHPDELIQRVLKALDGEWVFDEKNFDYPSLPKYIMYAVGKIVDRLGYPKATIIIAARFLSAVLGACVVGFTYRITRLVGGEIITAILAALLLISNSQLVLNAQWAHNDIYVTFFICLSLFALVKYSLSEGKLWLYFSFLSAGLAASSKYNGGIFIFAPVLIYLFDQRRMIFKDFLRTAETIFIGIMLSVVGYIIGTPKSLLWLAFYLKRVIPALQHHAIYGLSPESKIGLLKQWNVLESLWGIIIFLWILAAVIYVLIRLLKEFRATRDLTPQQTALCAIIVALLALDIPIMISYNVQPRFFLPMLPLLTILASYAAQDLLAYVNLKGHRSFTNIISGTITLLIIFSFLRSVSIPFLMLNDSRIPASEFLHKLPTGSTVEYTHYPPSIPRDNFSRSSHNYPLVFINYPDQVLPTSKHYEFNVGEKGIEKRQPDYLIVDSLTVDRLKKQHICDLHPLDCEFFTHLKEGKTSYQLIAAFSYRLPVIFPKIKTNFINPDIFVYQRLSN